MDAKSEDGQSITVPLLANYDETPRHTLGDVEKADYASHQSTGTTSFFKTIFNGLNSLSGVGILSVPYALASGGWLSLALLFIIAIATLYTGFLIKRCMDFDPNIRSYPDIGEKAYGTKGRIFVSIFMHLELYLVATGFLIMAGDNLHNLIPNFEINFYSMTIGGKQSFVILVSLVIMPTVWINNLTTLSYVSATGVLASVIIIASIFWVGTSDNIGFDQKGILLNLSGIPTAFSLYAFCYCAHPVFPTLYTSMRNQRQFSMVLVTCFLFCTITYGTMAILGYLMFGSKVQSQITLNLPIENISSKVAIYTALVNPIAKYALMLMPIANAIENQFKPYCNKRFFSLLVRTTLLITSVVVALTLPFFGLLMGLVGAFLSVTGSILIPCFCYLRISRAYRRIGLEEVVIGLTVLMGIVILITGTYVSLVQIVQNL
ncbi:amino acid transporter AVT1I-like [Olea europaea var. sylvestris]|uniref:amino acid transporter AVT1I-like n=1 Tax=Olea europaea var. sylvestris TaxID=158386 RepID=UPI000C1D5942|nr:amino acid transporter AVT1I-like [Olea europaea var. sylvestris]